MWLPGDFRCKSAFGVYALLRKSIMIQSEVKLGPCDFKQAWHVWTQCDFSCLQYMEHSLIMKYRMIQRKLLQRYKHKMEKKSWKEERCLEWCKIPTPNDARTHTHTHTPHVVMSSDSSGHKCLMFCTSENMRISFYQRCCCQLWQDRRRQREGNNMTSAAW